MDMGEAIVKRNGNRYTSDMDTQVTMLVVDETMFPVTWVHMDDDTVCDRHEVCPRDTYVRGGRIGFGTLHG
jgi:hypothetical protein